MTINAHQASGAEGGVARAGDSGELKANPLFNGNRLKIGTFNTNTVNALVAGDPDNLLPRWPNILAAAKAADAYGFEAIVPIARWKGYVDGNGDHYTHDIAEAYTVAAALAQATSYSAIFATTHAPTIHPMAVAKMITTIDHISGGRFALNIVGGWNRREFDMFGIELLGHAERYEYLADWLSVLKRLQKGEEFDYESPFFSMKAAVSRPRPMQAGGIPIMNAATSDVGMRFAARHSDIGFCMPQGDDIAAWGQQVAAFKHIAREEFGRTIQIWSSAAVTQRSSREEALAYRRHLTVDNIDTDALDSMMATICKENGLDPGDPKIPFMRDRLSSGAGYPLLGHAQEIADQLERMADAGIDGVLCSWVNYLDGIDRFGSEVIPLMEKAGLRSPHRPDIAGLAIATEQCELGWKQG